MGLVDRGALLMRFRKSRMGNESQGCGFGFFNNSLCLLLKELFPRCTDESLCK